MFVSRFLYKSLLGCLLASDMGSPDIYPIKGICPEASEDDGGTVESVFLIGMELTCNCTSSPAVTASPPS